MSKRRKNIAQTAAYLRRRKQKLMKVLKQVHEKKKRDCKTGKTSIALSKVDSEMSRLMNSV